MVTKTKEILHEARIKIMELPYFDEKLEVVASLLELEWKLKEEETPVYEDELAEEVFDDREEPWNG